MPEKINILYYPEKPLMVKARDVEDFQDSEFKNVVEMLLAKMDEFQHCVGLAANQIGSDLNVFVADASKNKREDNKYGLVIMVNAKIVDKQGLVQRREGCMSVPDLTVDVNRYEKIVIEARNENGEDRTFNAEAFEARVFQHEIDHLAGKVILDRARSSRDIYVRKQYR